MSTREAVNLSDITPYQPLGEDYILTGNGDISFVFEIQLPGVFETEEDDYNELVRKLEHYISGQQPDVVFHQVDFVFNDKNEIDTLNKNYTSRSDDQYFLGKPLLRHRTYLVVSYLVLSEDYYPSHSSTSFISTKQLIKKDVFKNVQQQYPKICQEVNALENELNGNGFFTTRKLYRQGITDLLYNTLNGTFDQWQQNVSENEVIDPIDITDQYLRCGQEYVGVVSLLKESKRYYSYDHVEVIDTETYRNGVNFSNRFGLPSSMSYAITIGTPLKHVVHTIIQPRTSKSLENQLKKENRGLTFLRGIGSGEAAQKQSEINQYIQDLGKTHGCTFAQSVWVYATDEKELARNTRLIKAQYKNVGSGVSAFIENMQTANLFFSTLPGVARENFMYSFSFVEHAVCFLPMETHVSSAPEGFEFCTPHGNRFTIDLKNHPAANNPNKTVFGPSGTGKSVFNNVITAQSQSKNYHVIVLDVGGSYKTNVEINGGKYVDCGKKENMSFNIFDCERDASGCYIYQSFDEEGNAKTNKTLFIYVLLAKILYGSKQGALETNESRRIYINSIKEYYDYINKEIKAGQKEKISLTGYARFFNDYYEELKPGYQRYIDIDSFNLLMQEYTEDGEKAHLLNGEQSFDISSDRFVVFDVQAIQKDPDYFILVSTIITDIVERKLAGLPRNVPKIFLIDEALDFLSGGEMGEYIAEYFRKIRKMGGEVIIAAQDAKFLESCSQLTVDSILSNADYKIVLGLPNESSVQAAQKLMGLVDKDISMIKSMEDKQEKGMFFLKINNKRMLLKNKISDHTLATFTTDPQELGVIEEYKKKYNDPVTAINNYVEDKLSTST